MPDNSLYPQAPAPTQSLLSGDPSKIIGLIGQINQNALFKQTINARNAIGQAYQGAIQDDGSIDTKALMQGIKNNPDAGFLAGEASAGALDRQGKQIQNATSMFGLQAGQNKVLMDGIGSLAAKPNISDEDLRNYAVTSARNSGVPTSMILSVVGSAPKDQAARHQWAQTIQNMAIGSAGTAQRVEGPPVAGAPQKTSLGAANYGGTFPTGLSPSETAAQSHTGAGAGDALAQARSRSLNYKQEVFPLEQAIPALEKLGKTGTGPGTEELNHVKSFLQSAGIPGLDADKITKFDEAKKYLTDFVNQNGNSGTNDKLAAAFAGNPSVNISNAAATDVAKSALALRRMKQAQLTEFEQSGKTDDQYPKFASQWNASHDPRAYGFDMMSVKQRRDILASLPEGKNGAPGPRDLFKLQVESANKAGHIGEPAK